MGQMDLTIKQLITRRLSIEGYLHLTFGGLIFRRDYFWRGLLLEFYGKHIRIALNEKLGSANQ